jgi:hypothetical protein
LIQAQEIIGRIQFQVLEDLGWRLLFHDHRDVPGEPGIRLRQLCEGLFHQSTEILGGDITPALLAHG